MRSGSDEAPSAIFSEFQAFAFYPIAIYGLVKFVRFRNAGFLAFAVLGHVAVVLTHNGAALRFTPVLLAIAVFQAWQFKSWKLFWAKCSCAAFRSADGSCLVPQPRGNEVRAH